MQIAVFFFFYKTYQKQRSFHNFHRLPDIDCISFLLFNIIIILKGIKEDFYWFNLIKAIFII